MKQRIELHQLEELSDTGRKKLYRWFFDNAIEPDLLSIGQMIELLDDNSYRYSRLEISRIMTENEEDLLIPEEWVVELSHYDKYHDMVLANALWSAVKDILEKEEHA